MATVKTRKPKKGDHVIIRNSKFFCSHCGTYQAVPYPMAVPIWVAMQKAFSKLHKDCAPVWKEPQPDLDKPLPERLYTWINEGEHGTSADTMYSVMSNNNTLLGINQYSHPHDPDDFKRCYKFLQWAPEWRQNRLQMMATVSPVWAKLVENWDKLSAMYEANQGMEMYSLMKELGS